LLYWRNQQRLVSVDAATSLEAIFSSWLWLRVRRLLGDSEAAEKQRAVVKGNPGAAIDGFRAPAAGVCSVIAEQPAAEDPVLDLVQLEGEQLPPSPTQSAPT
jgi:hypothetical protein